VLALFAVLLLIPLLYLPGWLFSLALLGTAQVSDALERHFERVVLGALFNGLLALILAEFGVFSLPLFLLLYAGVCALAGWYAQRAGASLKPGLMPRTQWLAQRWQILSFAAVGVLMALLLARPFEVVLGVRDAGVYADIGFAIARTGGIVQHDPIAAQIGIDQQSSDESLRKAAEQAETNFLGSQHPHRNIATRLRSAGFYINDGELSSGRVVPQFFHLFPAWIGLLAAFLGQKGGLLATGLLGWLGVWSVGMLGRRLAGHWVGWLGMLLLGLNGVQVWFSRYSTSEASVQFLLFAGLYAFAVMMQEPNVRVAGKQICSRATFGALLAGLALGQVALTRIDFILVVGPMLALLFYIWLTRRWQQIYSWFALSLGAMLVHAGLHVVFISRAYFFDTLNARLQDFALPALISLPFLTPTLRTYWLSRANSKIGIRLGPGEFLWNWQRIAIEAIVVLLAFAAIWAIRRYGQNLIAWGERLVLRWKNALLIGSATLIALLALYGYVIRPQIVTAELLRELPQCIAAGQISTPGTACLEAQGYIGAPITVPTHTNVVAYAIRSLPQWLQGKTVPPLSEAALSPSNPDATAKIAIVQANFVRVGWYLSPLGVILGIIGFVLWWRRGLNAASWVFLSVSLVATIFFVRQSYGTSDQTYIYILRRYVPQVYPAFSLAIAYALVVLAGRFPQNWRQNLWQTTRAFSAGGMALLLVAFMVLTNRGIYKHVEYDGALAQLETIAERFGDDDILLFHSGSRDEPDLIATPLTFAFGRNAFTIKSSNPENYAPQIARYIQRWQEQGREVYLTFGPSGGFGLPGYTLEAAGRMGLHNLKEFEQLTNQKPTNVQNFNVDFAVYRVVPDTGAQQTPQSQIGVDDYAAQIQGMYRAEQIQGQALAWTQGDAILRLPWPDQQAHSISLTLAGGLRPDAIGNAQVCLEFWPEGKGFARPDEMLGDLGCIDLSQDMQSYTIEIDPSRYGESQAPAMLLRMQSQPWVPAEVDPSQIDRRPLGVQFGGLTILP
jgi:hypothetical protein